MKLGFKPGVMPKTKAGDHERALALLASVADPKATKKSLIELRDATAAYDMAREAAEVAESNAAKRESAAQAAEADAIRARQLLADETAKAREELGKRETAVADRENLVTEAEKSQGLRDADLKRREEHLNAAGVRGF